MEGSPSITARRVAAHRLGFTRVPPAYGDPAALSVSALLSQALVAFTIEFDNESEHRLPHRTTNFGASSHGDGAWLLPLVIWDNSIRLVRNKHTTTRELEPFP